MLTAIPPINLGYHHARRGISRDIVLTKCPSQVRLIGPMVKGLTLELTIDAFFESLTDRSGVVVAIMACDFVNARV